VRAKCVCDAHETSRSSFHFIHFLEHPGNRWPLLSASQVGEVKARILFLKSAEELAGKADHTAQ